MVVTRHHCEGFPCSDDFLFHACRRHYPGGTARCCRYLVGRRRPSPKTRRVGFRNFLFEACSAFTHVSACMVARSPKVTRCTRVLQRICYLLRRPDCFRPSDRLAGWDSHPLEIDGLRGVLRLRHRSSSAKKIACVDATALARSPKRVSLSGGTRKSTFSEHEQL